MSDIELQRIEHDFSIKRISKFEFTVFFSQHLRAGINKIMTEINNGMITLKIYDVPSENYLQDPKLTLSHCANRSDETML